MDRSGMVALAPHSSVCLSLCAAVRSMVRPAPPKSGDLYTEDDWNETSTLDSEPYMLSKVGRCPAGQTIRSSP
jgi:hypothetical protein